MKKIGIAWLVALAFVGGCGGEESQGNKKQPEYQGGDRPAGKTSKFTSLAVAAAADLPVCKKEIEGSVAYLTSDKK